MEGDLTRKKLQIEILFKMIPKIIYWLGITLIIFFCGWHLLLTHIDHQNGQKIKGDTIENSHTKQEHSTLNNLIVKPIVKSPSNQVIFKYSFYLIGWILLFLVIPIGMKPFKRLKIGNIELEPEAREKIVIDSLNTTLTKLFFLSNWAKENKRGIFIANLRKKETVEGALRLMIKQMQEYYCENWEINFSFRVHKNIQDFVDDKRNPKMLKKFVGLTRESSEAILINKSHLRLRSFMLYSITFNESEYFLVLESYKTSFDEYDAYLLTGLSSLAINYFEHYQLLNVIINLES